MKGISSFFLLSLFSLQVGAQRDSANGMLIKYLGGNLMLGSLSSSTGVAGQNVFCMSTNYVGVHVSYGFGPGAKLGLGIECYRDLRKQFCPLISADVVYGFGHKDVFDRHEINERRYKAGPAYFLNLNGGVMWEPWPDPWVKVSPFVLVGYRYLLSDYSITPLGQTKANAADINDITYRSFESRISWNIGVRVDFLR